MKNKMPAEQWAAVHKNDDFICVEPLSGRAHTLQEDDGFAIYLEPSAPREVLGRAFLEALGRSRSVDPIGESHFFDWDPIKRVDKRWHDDVMQRYRYKSLKQMYKNMRYCWVERAEGKILIKPYRYDKPKLLTTLPDDRWVVIPATQDPAVAGEAVELGLIRCE